MLTLTPGAGATTPPELPKYIDSNVSMFAVFANSHWVVSGEHARAFGGTPTPTTQGYNIAGNESPRYMWADECSDDRQRLTFHRRIWLAGRPGSASFIAGPSTVSSWADPFKVIELSINGTVVLESHDTAVYDQLGGTARKAFRAGYNQVEVHVVKRANPSSIKACSGRHAPAQLGIRVALVGQGFPIDLGFNAVPDSAKVRYFRVAPGQKQGFFYTFILHNFGNAYSRAGRVEVSIQPGFLDMSDVLDFPKPPLHDCTDVNTNTSCAFDDWLAPDDQTAVTLSWHVTVPADAGPTDVEQMVVNWTVAPTNAQRDTKYENDSFGQTVYFCLPEATAYGCDKVPALQAG